MADTPYPNADLTEQEKRIEWVVKLWPRVAKKGPGFIDSWFRYAAVYGAMQQSVFAKDATDYEVLKTLSDLAWALAFFEKHGMYP